MSKKNIKIFLNPKERIEHLKKLSKLKGLNLNSELENSAYTPISLTLTPNELKPILKKRQETLKKILKEAGIDSYDPGSAPFSPDIALEARPDQVYAEDFKRVASAKYFVGHSILPSTGVGAEWEIASTLGKVSVILHDKNIRTTRLQPSRTINLAYENFEKQLEDFKKVFQLLQEFDVAVGFNDKKPALIGIHKNTKKIIDLEEEVYDKFPHLKYEFNGAKPIVKFEVKNSEIFYENKTQEHALNVKQNSYLSLKE